MMDNPFAAYSTKIYTVFLWAYNDCMWERCDPSSFFCEVYDRMELAVQAGKEELTRQIERLKEEFTADQNKSFDVFVKDKVNYLFMVKEQYPKHILWANSRDDKESQDWIKECQNWARQLICSNNPVPITPETNLYQLCSQQSEYIEYRLDYTGALISRLELRGGGGYYRMPSDYEEDAGVKFAAGQVVCLRSEPKKLYLVGANAGRLRDARNVFTWENEYLLYPFEQIECDCIPDYDHIHESELEAYDGQEYNYLQKMQLQFLQQYL
ncbi:hypothetical protein [Caproiciproducens galactitolivorans]|uniref:DUF4240 domain-containing protein n=1 Tax=Caproiciproducens galactitolivorans TaxID=642589 RepID=A0ABT4BVE7_9FIRM|nr:hypothetical protein [Caproiciproducens galactitolivorans]MCY1714871.1 hypothetical protein [Caproiciproducens galactitolivorans]